MRVLLYSECIDLLMIGFEWTLKGQALGQVQQQVQIINHGPVSNQNSQNGQTAMITQIQQSDHKVSWPTTLKGQRAKWKFTCNILITVNMGQKTTIHPRTSPGAPSVRALESN